MNTHRWWSVCGIVIAAMAFASCTQGQIEQVLQNKTQDMISGPCPPGTGPMSTTPEFCMYVTEVQLTNHDSGADVSLTLVNRTGRRLYLALSLFFYLTDSSGTKWEQVSMTGLPGINYGQAVPVDPNIETQVSVTFSNSSGQAPADLTFTMRGEIAVMKMDSRGEFIPRQAVAKRGFTLSGIRPMQVQPQSGGSTNQNPVTNLAPISPRGGELAAPSGSAPSQLSPCPPGTGPMSTTPEFCMYVTEVQLTNRGSAADVSLSLVNRTGRRLYLALSLFFYLTDSSGTKWEQVSMTGLPGINYGQAVPVDPNIETQVSVTFSNSSGQAPADLTFTMRGEIAVMKMDSRGEFIPRQAVAKRGFNLSGIRTMQVQPQSGGPTKSPDGAIEITVGKEQFMHALASMPYTSSGTGPVLYVGECSKCVSSQEFETDWKGQLDGVELRRFLIAVNAADVNETAYLARTRNINDFYAFMNHTKVAPPMQACKCPDDNKAVQAFNSMVRPFNTVILPTILKNGWPQNGPAPQFMWETNGRVYVRSYSKGSVQEILSMLRSGTQTKEASAPSPRPPVTDFSSAVETTGK